MTTATPVTRFAPSPTGFLHIGGARTALFCWLYARKHGGTFRLRIEDTDRARSTDEATAAILDGLDWLGLHHNGEVVYQSQRADRHVKVAQQLIESGHAYECYLEGDELERVRDEAREAGHALRSPWREGKKSAPEGKSPVIRFKVPSGQTVIHDEVQGEILWDNDQFDDLVLLRADGTPTYMLAVIVDDYDMGVTHIIRGDDHLINAGRQSLMIKALGWNVPTYAHVPLIHGPDGKKLSKRHGALGAEQYREMGYISSGLRNYLLKLGWSSGDQEIFADQDMIDSFDLGGINKSPARLDFDKMAYVNGQHMQMEDPEKLLDEASPFIEKAYGRGISENERAKLSLALPQLLERANTLIELADAADYILADTPFDYASPSQKPYKGDADLILSDLQLRLSDVEERNWTAEHLHEIISAYVSEKEIGFGKVGQPLRAALTAGRQAPDLSLVLVHIGRDDALARISQCIDYLSARPTDA